MGVSYNTSIVTNNLLFNVDFANTKCYTSPQTVVKNLAPGISDGEFIDVPTYSSNNNGFLSFVTNDGLRFPNSTTLDVQNVSVEVWVKTNSTNQNGFWFEKGTVNTQYSLFQEGGSIMWRHYFSNLSLYNQLTVTTSTYMNTSNWYQVVGTFTSGTRRIYINGSLAGSDTQAGTLTTNAGGMSIGVYGGYTGGRGYYYNGSLSACRVYGKELTANEILTNFNALRGRYGV